MSPSLSCDFVWLAQWGVGWNFPPWDHWKTSCNQSDQRQPKICFVAVHYQVLNPKGTKFPVQFNFVRKPANVQEISLVRFETTHLLPLMEVDREIFPIWKAISEAVEPCKES